MEQMQLLHRRGGGVGGLILHTRGVPWTSYGSGACVCPGEFWVLNYHPVSTGCKVSPNLLLFFTPRTFIFHRACFLGRLSSAHRPKQLSDSQISHKQCYLASAVRTVANSLYQRAILYLHKPWIKGENLQESAPHVKYFFHGKCVQLSYEALSRRTKPAPRSRTPTERLPASFRRGCHTAHCLYFQFLMRIHWGSPVFILVGLLIVMIL